MVFTVDASELHTLAVTLDTNTARLGAKAATALRKTAYDIEAGAKATIVQMGAVDTGAMLNSVSTTITGDGRSGSMTAEIGPTVEYAIYVHDGTSRVAPRPFMDPPFNRHAPLLEEAFAQLAGEVL